MIAKTITCAGIAALVCVVVSVPIPAQAHLRVCNHTSATIFVSLGEVTDAGAPIYDVSGWYSVPASVCRDLITGALDQRYYYLYAHNDHHTWTGNVALCVNPKRKFDWNSVPEEMHLTGWCKHPGVYVGFRQFDVDNNKDFSYSFHL